MDSMELLDKVILLAREAEQDHKCAAVVLFTLAGALYCPPGGIEELSRICANYSNQALLELQVLKGQEHETQRTEAQTAHQGASS